MKKIIGPLLAALLFAGCATNATTIKKDIPPAPVGQAAVFGRVVLLKTINRVSMPADNLSASVYLSDDGSQKTYKISTIDSGDFGVYLPPGSYRVLEIKTNDFKFISDIVLTVPKDQKAVYAGTILLDGEPDGVVPGTVNNAIVHAAKRLLLGTVDTWFVYQVKDDQKEFEARLKRAMPQKDIKFAKTIFEPRGGTAAGYYPNKLHRAKDIENALQAGTGALDEVVDGTLVLLPYYINPLVFIGFL